MNDYRALEQQLSSELGLTRRPVAIAFADTLTDVGADLQVRPAL